MTFFARPKVVPRSLTNFGAGAGRCGLSPARSKVGKDTPRALRPPTQSHSRRETRSSCVTALSMMESISPPQAQGLSLETVHTFHRPAVVEVMTKRIQILVQRGPACQPFLLARVRDPTRKVRT